MGPLEKSKEYNKWLNKWNIPQNEKDEQRYKEFKYDFCSRLIFLGFKDYMAARNLLLNENSSYHLVGLVLASSAVEKYLKAFLGASDYYVGNIHMNDLSDFKDALNNVGKYGKRLLDKLDITFLELLSDTYKFRYFSETKHADGALINQAIGELDFTVNSIEASFDFKKEGEVTEYQKAMKNKSHPIHKDNFVLQYINRNDFMERSSRYYAVKHIKFGMILEQNNKREKDDIEYKGHISRVKISF